MSNTYEIRPRELAALVATALGIVFAFALAYTRYFPDPPGTVGHDYGYFLPRLLAGAYWFEVNGPLALPWFSPAFGAGLPFYANPANAYVSVPQALALVVGPLAAVRWTLHLFAVIGFLGTWRLARVGFGLAAAPAWLGAVVFAFQGGFATRMLVGHVGYHAAMLVPWIAHFALAPLPGDPRQRRWRIVRDACLGGAAMAYLLQCGHFYGLLPGVLATVALALLAELARRDPRAVLVRLAAAGAIALALSAAKLLAGLAFLAGFPRSGYPLPGAASAWKAATLAFRALFLDAPADAANASFVGLRFALGRHEWDYGVSWVPLAFLIAGSAAAAWRFVRAPRPVARRAWLAAASLAAVLAVPVALNVHAEGWTQLLKSLPVLGSASSNVRWLAAYAPIAALGAALACGRLAPPRGAAVLALLGGLATVAAQLGVDRSHTAAPGYSTAAIEEAWRELDARGAVQPIRAVVVPPEEDGGFLLTLQRDDALAGGGSQLFPYEPIFGYELEWQPAPEVGVGPALVERDGALNFQHPGAFLYPAAVGRAAGARFRSGERAELERFLAYGPLEVDWPWRQRVANAVNVLALALLPLTLALAWRRGRSA